MNKSWLSLSVFLMLMPAIVHGQLDNSSFYDRYGISAGDSAAIKFGLEAFGYIRNNEFREDPVPGYTLFGYQFRPYFSYFPTGRIRLDAGGFFQKDFGEENFTDIRPVFSIRYTLNHFSLIFGTLEGAMSHRLIEPLYNFENVIGRRIEDGFQLKYVNNRVFFDTWIEWINMIEFGEDALEEFNYGISLNLRLFESSAFILDLPVQLLANHRGGEIDVSTEPANTLLNGAAGLGLEFPVDETGPLHTVRFDGYYGFYSSSDDPGSHTYMDGDGWFMNLTGKSDWLDVVFSYWHGNRFYAPLGGPLYQSVFYLEENTPETQDQRELLFLRLLFHHDLSGVVNLSFRFEPVYDLSNGQFDHSEGLYLRFRTDFLLNRKRKP